MRKFDDIIGRRYGRLTVLERDGWDPVRRVSMYRCRCDCGTVLSTRRDSLVSGGTNSCGCLRSELARASCRTIPRPRVRVEVTMHDGRTRVYASMAEAAEAIGCCVKTVRKHLGDGESFYGYYLKIID